ncbi:response regulator [Thermonema rossianum]|uniref:response regulator n=1 Tax=Thermonema rossianum TaxID=55505 RepID=UPI00056ECE0B|nr:response regulator [Thermonema rossianum]
MSKKILVIEDHEDIRENIIEILSLSGYEAEGARNGKEGLEKAQSLLPDLIICDIMMPELDGYSVLKILAQKPETASIPFIFLTAKTERSDIRKGMSLGADDYLTKPFEESELLEAVEARFRKQEILQKHYANTAEGMKNFAQDAKQWIDLLRPEEYKTKTYKKKETIYWEGEVAHFVYLVEEGEVKTFRVNPEGKELITAVYKPGDFFGYLDVMAGDKHNDTAEALQDTELLLIPKEDFVHLISGNPAVAVRMVKMLAGAVKEKEENLLQMAYDSVRRRVAKALVKLAEDDFNAEVHLSREELANIVGIAKETLIRTLSDLKSEGMIEVNGNTIRVVEPEQLLRI